MSKKDMMFLNGVKGIAAIMVVLHHFLLAFLPATYYGDSTMSHIPFELDVKFAQSIFSFIFNGNFMVHIFLMVSAFIYANKLLNIEDNELSSTIPNILIKRYLRLIVPIFVISLIIYALSNMDLFSNIEVSNLTKSRWLSDYYMEKLTIKDVINCTFYLIPFKGNDMICSVFWCIPYFILGCYLTILLSIYINHVGRKSIYLLMILIILSAWNSSNYLSILLGILLAFGIKYGCFNIKENIIVGSLFIVLASFFGGDLTCLIPKKIYKCYINSFVSNPVIISHSIGAFLLIFGFLKLSRFKKVFSNKSLLNVSRYSFSMYLIHIPVLYTIGTGLFKILYVNVIKKYLVSVFITLIIFSGILFFLSILFNRIIETKLYEFVLNKYFKLIKEG